MSLSRLSLIRETIFSSKSQLVKYIATKANTKMSAVMTGYGNAKLITGNGIPTEATVIDFRSDTVTKPNNEMRTAMMNADVGDDVYGEDPTVNELQKLGAQLMGKEAALFVPSGTMSNLIALLTHCKLRGSEAIVGDESHILHYEQTGAAQFGGINLRSVKTFADGTLDLEEAKKKIRNSKDAHQSHSVLLCVENTHNRCGGRIVPQKWIVKAGQLARENNMKFHLDGARIFNAAVALDVSVSELVEPFDSVSVCLSKGLGAPVGSLLIGTKHFIEEAHRCRKALGGGMRQAGILAAAGILSLTKGPTRLAQDHIFTKQLAVTAQEVGKGVVEVDLDTVETNMVMLKVEPISGATPNSIVKRFAESTEKEVHAIGQDIRLLAYPMTETNIRIVVHCSNTPEDIKLAQDKLGYVFDEIKQSKAV
ncbi:L-allo-threonine aldolase-like [Daphnia pulicaria]|uniref:L-allo-threonine aldolase-like n=1 Tax=Daphnia pulicaria TaxID=35523 RepID=UPI001EECB97B|nr:L-allo-threonine aldolase-like [Daphnia pulicaria]